MTEYLLYAYFVEFGTWDCLKLVIVTARERIRATFRSVVNVERKPIHCQLEIQTKYTFGFHNRLKLNRIALGHHLKRTRLDI